MSGNQKGRCTNDTILGDSGFDLAREAKYGEAFFVVN